MTKYFYIEPEVAGGLGKATQLDASVHPPVVTKLHYEFSGWLGDEVLESFPCFIVSYSVRDILTRIGATGIEFDGVKVTTSREFRDIYPNLNLPQFVWLKVTGTAGRDDFGIASDLRLVVSERIVGSLPLSTIAHAEVSAAS